MSNTEIIAIMGDIREEARRWTELSELYLTLAQSATRDYETLSAMLDEPENNL